MNKATAVAESFLATLAQCFEIHNYVSENHLDSLECVIDSNILTPA